MANKWIVTTMLLLLLVFFLCGLAASDNSPVQQSDDDGGGSTPSESRDVQHYLDGPLSPVYEMTECALESVIQPQYLTELEDHIGSEFLVPKDFLDSFEDDWEEWLFYFLGFAIIAIIGILLILCVPFIGGCVACCRCCGNCGGRPRPMESKCSGCKRACCGITFFIVTSAITLGVICMFAFNVEINQRLSKDEDGNIWDELSGNLSRADRYFDDTLEEMDTMILDEYVNKKDLMMAILEDIPSEAVEFINNETHVIDDLDELLSFTGNLTSLNNSLESATNTQEELDALLSSLRKEIEELRNETFGLLDNCTTQKCDDVRNETEQLSVRLTTSSIQLENVTMLVHQSLEQNLDQAIEAAATEFDKIIQTVNMSIGEDIQEVKQYADDIQDEIENFINDTAKNLDKIDINAAVKTLQDIKENIAGEVEIAYWATVAFGVPLCIIVFCGFLGLLFGIVCPRPSPNTGCCSADRTLGSDALLAGVGFTFIFYWIYAMVVLVMFVAGGVTHTEVCRHLVNYDQGDSAGVLEIIDRMAVYQMNESLDLEISPLYAYTSCEDNLSFYRALDLENNGYNISDIIDTTTIKEAIDEIKKVAIDIPMIDIMNDSVYNILTVLGQEFDSLNFSLYYDELNNSATTVGLLYIVDLLSSLDHNDTVNETEKQILMDKFTDTNDELVKPAEELALNLTRELQMTEAILPDTSLASLASDLKEDENFINTNGTALVGEFINITADNLYGQTVDFTDQMITTVEDNLGQCEPLYSALTGTIDSVCVKSLYPVNGLWFSLGWCLVFLIPSIIIAFILADEYRKAHPYIKGIETTFDEPGLGAYDAYAGVPDYWTFDNTSTSSVQMYQLPRAQLNNKPQTKGGPLPKNNQHQQSDSMAAFDNPIYSNDEDLKIPRPTVIPTPYYPPTTIQRKQQQQQQRGGSPSPPPSYRDAVDSDERVSYDDNYDTRM